MSLKKAGGQGDGGGGNDHRDPHREEKGVPGALFGPVHLVGAQILAHKSGGRQTQGLHRQDDELVQLAVGGPAGHTVQAEEVDVGLDEDIGEGGDGHLQGGGHANADNLPQDAPVHP